jgi:hypothetical protein
MKHTLKLAPYVLDTIDLKDLWKYSNWADNFKFFNLRNGDEHYRLLSYFSWQFPPNTTIIDVGTFLGFSALALSHNPDVKVISYNIQDDIGTPVYSVKNKENVELRIKNCIDDLNILLNSPFIMLDTAHNGDFEQELIQKLIDNKYRGMVLCDDIHLNYEMIQFWNWVPLKKIDLSKYGHWSGTGLIIFDENTIDLEIVEPIIQSKLYN